MRGVVSLAAALALPAFLMDGTPFPQRNLIVFLTFCVIFVTLVLQGVTLPPLIRALGLAGTAKRTFEEQEARRVVAQTVVSYLENAKASARQESVSLYEDLARHYRQRLASLQPGTRNGEAGALRNRQLDVLLEATRVERETAIRLRDEGSIDDKILRRIEREMDLAESSVATIRET